MYNFKLPSKLVQRGDPLPSMPEGVGMQMPSARPMQPQQSAGIEELMANYRQPQMASQAPSFGLGAIPMGQPASGMGMNAFSPQMGQNQPASGGPSFFTL